MNRLQASAAIAALSTALAASSANALVINDFFDPSITSAPNAAQIISAITQTTNQYQHLFSNPVTVNIYFQQQAGSFLGQSESTFYFDNYGNYTNAAINNAIANPGNAPLTQGLISSLTGPSNVADLILATGADFRANGYIAPGVLGEVDGQAIDTIITLSTSFPLDFDQNVPGYNGSNLEYNARDTIAHEVDEALGIGGSGSALNFIDQGITLPGTYEGALDRFRYSAPGAPSFSTSGNTNAYFSLDNGVTKLATFNQNIAGDLGDLGPTATSCGSAGGFGGPFGVIQDAFGCYNEPTTSITRGSIEYTMLESIGWDPTPEPAAWTMLILGVGMIGIATRRRREAIALAG